MSFNAVIFLEALRVYGYEMSDEALEYYVRQRIRDFLATEHAPAEVFDFCDELSKLPCKRVGKLPDGTPVSVGDIDGFGQALFDVARHYERPAP